MANQGLAEEFSYLSVDDVRKPPAPKLPPALQPRHRVEQSQNPVTSHNSHPQIYRAVPAVFRPSMRNDEELPPPPVVHSMTTRYTEDNFPPPPLFPPPPPTTSDLTHTTYYSNRNDAYNLPPPPPPIEHATSGTAMATPTVYNPSLPPPSSYPSGQPPYSSVSSSYNSRSVSVTAPSSAASSTPSHYLNQPNYMNHSDLPPPPQGPSQAVPSYSNVHSSASAVVGGGIGVGTPQQSVSYKAPVQALPQQHKYPGYSDPVNPSPLAASSPAGSYTTNSLPRSDGRKVGKEAEVDALTSLLMQNIESAGDPDFFGMCSKCGHRVVGPSNGCTAMDQVFHIDCFICDSCGEDNYDLVSPNERCN
ncbi:extensin [Octopus sinensis]|uniref:Extensin n=1 Tax=Octopus sinensis TaxID=2607531 RepID=A0A6P7TR51_9MOLL|nr:extensin [Octopus sinensis]